LEHSRFGCITRRPVTYLVTEKPGARAWVSWVKDVPVMATDKECIGYARECVRLAGLSGDPQMREQLLNRPANGWPLPWANELRATPAVLCDTADERALSRADC
jgi:hypothetical protein